MAQKLIKKLADYQEIINRTPAMVVIWRADPDYPVEFISENVKKYLGYTADDFLSGKVSWLGITHPDDLQKLEDEIVRFRQENIQEFMQQYRLKTKSGEYRWFEDNTNTLLDDDGNITHYQAIIMDITERRLMEDKLKEDERFLSNLFASVQEGITVLDKSLTIVRVNPIMERWYSQSLPLIGKKCYEVYHKRKKACDGCLSKEALKTGESLHKLTQKSGTEGESVEWHEVFSFPLIDVETGETNGAIEYVRDITERKKAEESLKESETKFRTLFDLANDAIFLINGDKIVDCNKKTLEMFSCKADQIIGKTVFELSPQVQPDGSDSREKVIEKIHSAMYGEQQFYEWRYERFDGTVFDAEVNLNLFKFKRDFFVQSTVRDITYRKRMEEELVKSKNLESIGTLAGGIAHDFNNLLTVILGNISLAKMRLKHENKALERLTDAEKASMSAKELTQQLITFARGGEPWKNPLKVPPMLKSTARFALSGSKIKCKYFISDDLNQIYADEVQLRQAVHNIINNAREAMPEGGAIVIRAENVNLTQKDNIPLPDGDYIKISIEDKGLGIKEEHLGKVFDPYFTTKEMGSKKGMGLGLSISYSIIKRHDGYILIESVEKAGTTVHIYLPAYAGAEKRLDAEKGIPIKGRVLVMDDMEEVRQVTTNMLIELGYEVASAEDGKEAIELYKKAIELDSPFDAVILDLTIQGGMGGKETCAELTSIDPTIKALIATGYTDDPIVSNFKKYGFKAAITKPFKIEELEATLKVIIQHV